MSDDGVRLDREGIHFPDNTIPVCDLLIDGQRVMSLSPSDQKRQPDGRRYIAWPDRLAELMVGTGQLTVREHATGTVHYDAEVSFDGAPGRMSVTDAHGRPMVINKWGGLSRSFEGSEDVDRQAKMTQQLLADLNDLGYRAYAAYGTLLGAVRTGHVIGHDNDCDVTYLSRYEHPADIARESFRMQRDLIAKGWDIERGRLTKLTVMSLHKVDIFTSYFTGDIYHLDQWAEGPMDRDKILPLSTVELEGYELPAPADPSALLALIYGPGWRTPDPAFSYDKKSPHLARARGWFGGHRLGAMSWNRYWRLGERSEPSPFVDWIGDRIDPGALLVDLGSGSGADLVEFARRGIHGVGLDSSINANSRARKAAATVSPAPEIRRVSVADMRAGLAEATRLALAPGRKTVTARLLLDALPPEGYENFWRMLRLLTAHGGDAFLEFHTRGRLPLPRSKAYVWQHETGRRDVVRRIRAIGGEIVADEPATASVNGLATPSRRIAAHFG